MKRKWIAICSLFYLLIGCNPSKETTKSKRKETIKTVFYNVENLFDTKHTFKKSDLDFTPTGKYQWTPEKYQQKLNNIAKTLNKLNADIIGLAEVENKQVLTDLVSLIHYAKLEIVHYESYDIRGIDVALLYNPNKISLTDHQELRVKLTNGRYAGSRNILKTTFENDLIVYVNHWPSRRGGKEQNRIAYSKVLSEDINKHTDKDILVMGDFNDTPTNTSIRNLVFETELLNPFNQLAKNGKGTATFRQKWYLFDQIMLKSNHNYQLKNYDIVTYSHLINSYSGKYNGYPLRSFSKNRFQKSGSSDHLPVSLTIVSKD